MNASTGQKRAKKSNKRVYQSSTRQRHADQTRSAIATAARRLLTKSGYAGMTMSAVALAAGVAVPTVYAVFGSKKGIVAELLDQARFGQDYQALVRQAMLVSDPAERLSFAASIARQVYESEIPVQSLLRGAGMLAPELASVENEREGERYEIQGHLIDHLLQANLLQAGLDRRSACDILWALTSRDLYRMLVQERGWDADKYERWLKQILHNALVNS
ncbi:MAG: transcriptional regulator, TetR family [Edaphobacter sp.]|nr:transcriptional regulator, TetR family [Edaphobacter sp.]